MPPADPAGVETESKAIGEGEVAEGGFPRGALKTPYTYASLAIRIPNFDFTTMSDGECSLIQPAKLDVFVIPPACDPNYSGVGYVADVYQATVKIMRLGKDLWTTEIVDTPLVLAEIVHTPSARKCVTTIPQVVD